MRFSDTLSGLLLFIIGVVVAVHASTFPAAAGQGVGPGFFPIVVGAGIAIGGVALMWSGRKQREVAWLTFEDWVQKPRMRLNAILVIGVLIGYALVVDTVGFFVTAFVFLVVLLLAFGVRKRWVAPIAAIASVALHGIFYTLLHVQLPWGWLEGIRLVMAHVIEAFRLVMDPYVLTVILASALYGLFVGAIPGLTATMATALLVPVTFLMPPVPAIACMVTATAMAIFAGDIPGALLRIPGTPASAAYCDEAYAMTRNGQAELVLGAGLVFSVIGGLFGTGVLVTTAPMLAEVALKFSSFEYFWLVLLGLTCAVFIAPGSPLRGLISLALGLLIATIGFENPAAFARFTFGSEDLMSGLQLTPVMIGMFAVSEVIRYAVSRDAPIEVLKQGIGRIFRGQGALLRKYPVQVLRGSVLGTAIGALPGAGADIAAWISYALSKKFSRTPEKFGTGHVEGVIESGAANNSALAGAWIPALVFGIPGDSITAIVIGVLYMKGMNPGPTLFIENPQNIYAVFIVFILANLLMLPLGWLVIKVAKNVLRVPRGVLMPIILLFCVVGAFAINNSLFDIGVMLVFGLIAYVMEANRFPIAPAILGLVLGGMLEQNFVTSLIKADGNIGAFFTRPIAGMLGVATILIWISPIVIGRIRAARNGRAA